MTGEKTHGPRLLSKVDSEGHFYELYQVDEVPNVFVDGISDMLTGPTITQLKLHRVDSVDFDQRKEDLVLEKRIMKVNIIVPTLELIDIAKRIIAHFEANREQLLSQMRDRLEKTESLLGQGADDNVREQE